MRGRLAMSKGGNRCSCANIKESHKSESIKSFYAWEISVQMMDWVSISRMVVSLNRHSTLATSFSYDSGSMDIPLCSRVTTHKYYAFCFRRVFFVSA